VKVLSFSTTEMEGGAARAANRLHQGLLGVGVDAYLMVQSRSTSSDRVISAPSKFGRGLNVLRPSLDQLPLYVCGRKGLGSFACQWFPDAIHSQVQSLRPNVLQLHWVNKGFLRIETVGRLAQPIVWTLHDMWPMTGGCFHSGECERYMVNCGSCPKLDSRRERDLSRWIWRRKRRAWGSKSITVVCPSEWMAKRARTSSLFAGRRIEVIPNGLDLQRYRPVERNLARQWLGLPQECRLIMFSAVKGELNPFKGYQYLPDLLEELDALDWRERLELVVLGDVSTDVLSRSPLRTHYLGHLQDEATLALAYGAVDVFIAPSVIDNLPNTVMEAMACGTPTAAFQVGGIPEMIDHQENGWLAAPGKVDELAAGVDWILQDSERGKRLGLQARRKALQEYDQELQAKRYLALYQDLLEVDISPQRRREHGDNWE
jgi:glycosyltransferase involved in cell wall biosynthesis